jgi:hypothetical protein
VSDSSACMFGPPKPLGAERTTIPIQYRFSTALHLGRGGVCKSCEALIWRLALTVFFTEIRGRVGDTQNSHCAFSQVQCRTVGSSRCMFDTAPGK